MSSTQMNGRVARRLKGLTGVTQAAADNAARLREHVVKMQAEIDAMTERTGAEFKTLRELVDGLRAEIANRCDSLREDVGGLLSREADKVAAQTTDPVEPVTT